MRLPVPSLSQHSGFTLIEIMAAMTIFFMGIGILVSGVAQAMRLAEVGQAQTTYSRDAAIRLGWFRDTVGLAIIPAQGSEQGPPLTGNTRNLSGVTLQSLNTNSAGPGTFAWALAFNSRTNETELAHKAQPSLINFPVQIYLIRRFHGPAVKGAFAISMKRAIGLINGLPTH